MRKSLRSSSPFLLLPFSSLLLFALFLAACTAPTETPMLETASPPEILSATPTVTQTPVPSATFTSSLQQPTPTIIVPSYVPTESFASPTATNVPVTWLVDWQIVEFPPNQLHNSSWLDGDILLFRRNDQLFSVEIFQDHVSEPAIQPTPTDFPFRELAISPGEKYFVTCDEKNLSLYESSTNQLMSRTQTFAYCANIRWNLEETALSFVSALDGQIYIWSTDGAIMHVIGSAISITPANWSPDGKKILAIRGLSGPSVTLDIAYPDGSSIYPTGAEVFVGAKFSSGSINWFTNDVVVHHVVNDSYASDTYYDLSNGKEIIKESYIWFVDMVQGKVHHQKASVSPDKHWFVLDFRKDTYDDPRRNYTLFDMISKESFVLSDDAKTNLIFLGWNDDSTLFYLLTRPVDETTQPAPSGLLALNPITRQFTEIIPGAMYAALNPQQDRAFTLLPTDGQLTAALYTLSGELLATLQPITDNLPYLTPGEGLPIPAAWSNDGTQIVFSDVWGDLWLADTSGTLTQLADNLGFAPEYPRQPQFSWSPDDTHLLITFNDRAWVVTVP